MLLGRRPVLGAAARPKCTGEARWRQSGSSKAAGGWGHSCSSASDTHAPAFTVSLVEARRINGTVRQQHIESLGAVGSILAVRERNRVWQALHDCVGRRGIAADAAAKLMAAVQARIPYPTQEEIGAAELSDGKTTQIARPPMLRLQSRR